MKKQSSKSNDIYKPVEEVQEPQNERGPKKVLSRYETYQAILTGKKLHKEEMFRKTVEVFNPLGHCVHNVILEGDVKQKYQ